MSYLVLARKYRPQQFEDVVRQEHITRALGNALTSGRLAHAILLSGPRGTGKTTIARILAKCVNCESGPTATPCNTCRSCREITGGHAADVFEIDGASNNRVENVRELRENANYMPAHSPYKIYIIDEVHMLSDSAFNALLKILEEPPAHVKFFFATTDPNKIPITILSRCQRHDCRRIDINAIIQHMAMLCEKENVDISDEALTIIAREADGSIRDALSLLDLIITSTSGKIDATLIADILGGLDRQSLFDISRAVFSRDPGKIIEIIGRLYDRGQNMVKLFAALIEYFRNLLVVKLDGGNDSLSDVSEYELNSMREQVNTIPQTYIHQILDILFKEEPLIRHTSQPKLAVEMAFIRVMQIRPALPMETLIEKIDALQKGLADKLPTGCVSGPPGGNAPETIPDTAPVSAAKSGNPASEAMPEIPENHPPRVEATKTTETAASINPQKSETPRNVPAEIRRDIPVDEKALTRSWGSILAAVTEKNPALAACFNDSQFKKTGKHQLTVFFKSNQFNINYANRDANRSLLQSACSTHFGNDIEIILSGKLIKSKSGMAQKREAKKLESESLNHPLVEEAMKIFNGKIVEINILQEG